MKAKVKEDAYFSNRYIVGVPPIKIHHYPTPPPTTTPYSMRTIISLIKDRQISHEPQDIVSIFLGIQGGWLILSLY